MMAYLELEEGSLWPDGLFRWGRVRSTHPEFYFMVRFGRSVRAALIFVAVGWSISWDGYNRYGHHYLRWTWAS